MTKSKGWEDIEKAVLGAVAWFVILALACWVMWRIGSVKEGGFERAQSQAIKAVEWSLTGEVSKLGRAMTAEAVERAVSERKAARLDEALTSSKAKVFARAYPIEVYKAGPEWEVKGLATAHVLGGLGQAQAPWRGAWIAHLSADPRGELKVSWMRMSSLPEKAAFDASSLPLVAAKP